MERVLEPELMTDDQQAEAYALADFADVNQSFVDRFLRTFPDLTSGVIADLGCGPADIPIRIAHALPNVRITAVDGSAAMLAMGHKAIGAVADRVTLVEAMLPNALDGKFDAVISNSLLHHLPDPAILWNEVRRLAKPGAPILVVDLYRPDSTEVAKTIVEQYSGGEPEVLRTDFFNSLCAAFTIEELTAQLVAADLASLAIEVISDRHFAIYGTA